MQTMKINKNKKKRYRTKIVTVIAFTVAAVCAAAVQANTCYDDDQSIDFMWSPPATPYTHHNVYVSVDGGAFILDGTSTTESYSVNGNNSQNYSIKVCAVNYSGAEGPSSPNSDPVICDTVAPTKPDMDDGYSRPDTETVEVTLQQPSEDENMMGYQVKGGQYSDWTYSDEDEAFIFNVEPDREDTLYVRAVDYAGNIGPSDSLVVRVDYDSDGISDVDEIALGTDLQDPDSDGDGTSDGEEVALGTDPVDDSSFAFVYSTPVKGWSRSFTMLSNIGEQTCSVLLKILDRDGNEKLSREVELGPLETLNTWSLIGNIYSFSKDGCLRIVSDGRLSVNNSRWSAGAGWGFDVPEISRAAGEEFTFPLNGWSKSWFDIANPGWSDANLSVIVYDANGQEAYQGDVIVPAQGMRSSWDFLDGSVYALANPAVIKIVSDQQVVVDHGSWGRKAGWGFNNLPLKVAAGKKFSLPLWGWSNSWVMCANSEENDANLTIKVHDKNGVEKISVDAVLPGNGFLRTWDLIGDVYNYAAPAVVTIQSDLDIVVERGNWSSNGGFASAVAPESVSSGMSFIFPVAGWSSSSSNILNTSAETADVTINVYDGSGELQETLNTSIAPLNLKTTWELTGNLYAIANPALVEIVSDRPVTVDSNCWTSRSGVAGWSFTLLPDYEDNDGDGLPDDWELAQTGSVDTFDAEGDPDSDGLSNIEEWRNRTDPNDSDSDGDGLDDGEEVHPVTGYRSNPNKADSDDDGLDDLEEKRNGANPNDKDSDGDGVSDGGEVNTWGTSPIDVDSDDDHSPDGEEIKLGTDPADPSSRPYIYAASVKGWSNAYFDICNISDASSAGVLTVYDCAGSQVTVKDFTAGPMQSICSWYQIGDIYSYCASAFVRIASAEKLRVDQGRWSTGSGWGLDVNEISVGAGTGFVLPMTGWKSAWFNIGNPTALVASVAIEIYDESGTLNTVENVEVPAFGTLSSWDFLNGSVYNICAQAVIKIASDQPVVVDHGSWTSGAGSAASDLPTTSSSGQNFVFPTWGWGSSRFLVANASSAPVNAAITIRDTAGNELDSTDFVVPGNGMVDTWDVVGNIYGYSKRAAVSIETDRDVVIVNQRWSASAGWEFTVPPQDVCSGYKFTFPVLGWSYSASSIANCSTEQANVSINVYNADGTLQASYDLTIEALGTESTWPLLGNIYQVAQPAVVEITSDQPIIVDNGRWSSSNNYSGWGFTILPED
jgi:hypothetical protein